MPSVPDDHLPVPEEATPESVWADRTGHRTLVGRNQRGVEIPIGKGEGEISPGELLKLGLIGCAGMTSDINLSRRLGEDFAMRLWAHGTSDEDNRYAQITEQVQLPLEGLTEAEIDGVVTVFGRAVAAGCTVERTVVPGVEVTHDVLGAGAQAAQSAQTGQAQQDGDAR
ncbi:OsmC family protein [Brachybacterium sacelli]|uniref:OsmC-like protein n=1 Tax=Brachybacterium sacelli TaxID=173364 RepID=A0ABS4X6Z9_9MICO|nr:OsmC family protein [Brachybacterium sacelli]MBP2384231.1 putative OsmC-like protein [Brachybacterium sacelli]